MHTGRPALNRAVDRFTHLSVLAGAHDAQGISMNFDIEKLIWLFPIAFILHDFEELMLFEPWLKKNSAGIMSRVKYKIPAFLEKQLQVITGKSTAQFATPIFLIFALTSFSSLLAAEFGSYPLLLFASSLFFLHGFVHIGQAIFLRKYVPALITSVLVAIPYGIILFWNLFKAGRIDIFTLSMYFLAAIVLAVPFIMGMHILGEWIYKKAVHLLIG